ncbi:MAG: acetyl-CoA carboxylase, carboxyltransferase subunit beta [Candidatus Marinimicrobia bacterium]|nr:acetyl-CoA carboxylase, carboxyltransferase subunit beta [Candidatus Neomarinimicrobiota bacterium]
MAKWYERTEKSILSDDKKEIPEGVWKKCPQCGEIIYYKELARHQHVCFKCNYHFRINSDHYLVMLCDGGTYKEYDAGMRSGNPLDFSDPIPYEEQLAAAIQKTGLNEAVRTVESKLNGMSIHLAVMDFRFIGGSMGSVVGEKIARIIDRSLEKKFPLIIISASGGARMQEGVLSLMQMVKTASRLARLHDAGIPYISVLTHPTTGGVTASFAMLGDVIFAEPGALIGFAGPRVIRQTIGEELPEGFQTAEFLLKKGFVDAVVDRRNLKKSIDEVLKFYYA